MRMRTRNGVVLGLLLTAVAASPAMAADDFFLKVPGVTGEATATPFAGWIEVYSFSAGVALGECSSLNVMKQLDSTSPYLIPAAMTGQVYGTIELAALRSGEEQFVPFRLKLHNAVIQSVQESGSSGGGTPVESVSIQPARIELIYYVQDETGGSATELTATFDCQKVKTR